MKEPGRIESLRAMGKTNAVACEARLEKVHLPTLILFGAKDPDFPDPAAEAKLLTDRTGGTAEIVPDAGHYPHEEDPSGIADRLAAFLAAHSGSASAPTNR